MLKNFGIDGKSLHHIYNSTLENNDGRAAANYINMYDLYLKCINTMVIRYIFENCVVDFSGFSSDTETAEYTIDRLHMNRCTIISHENLKYIKINELSIEKATIDLVFSNELIKSLDGISELFIDDSCILNRYPYVTDHLLIDFYKSKEKYEIRLSDKVYNLVTLANNKIQKNNHIECFVHDSPKINELVIIPLIPEIFTVNIEDEINIIKKVYE